LLVVANIALRSQFLFTMVVEVTFLRNVPQFLVTANVVLSPLILCSLVMEAIYSLETLVPKRDTWHISEDGTLN
jgi:hypothetical protein